MDPSRKRDDFVGQTLLHYQVTERLGAGGLGVVSRAIDLKLKRTVALKFFPPSLTASDDAKMRFVREMRTCATLEHPNIGVLHALEDTGDGRLFLVMPFYEGQTLAKRIDHGTISPSEAVAIALQLLQGLAEAHGRGIVHGDVKPENLIFNAMGVLKILDFGMSKFYGNKDLSPSAIPGTVAYMSPERAAGAPVDRRSDLWSAGVILYEMVKGKRLFRGTDPNAMMAAILADEPISRAGFPPGLDRIVGKALERNPDLRYQNAGEFVHDLELEQRGRLLFDSEGKEPTLDSAKPFSYETEEDERDHKQRSPRVAWLIGGFVVVLAVVGGVFAWQHTRQSAPLPGVPVALGRVRLLQERYPEAVTEFEQALAVDPTDEGAYHGLAQAYAAMGLAEKAEEAWRSDIALHPTSVDPYDQLAKFELNRGNYAAAITNFRAALNLSPLDPEILSDLGAALLHAGSLDESRKVLEQSIHLSPSLSGWSNLGDLELKQKHYPDAAADYAKAVDFNGNDYHLWTNLAIAYSRTSGDKEKAREAYASAQRTCRDALKPHPNDPVILSDLAAILAAEPSGRQEAQTVIKHALSLSPDDPHVQLSAAEVEMALGHRRAAQGLVTKLLNAGYPAEKIAASPALADFVRTTHSSGLAQTQSR